MRQLYKVFHEQDRSTFDQIYQNRIHFESVKKFNLKIKPQHQPDFYDLYYIPTNRMINQVNKIQILARSLGEVFIRLPEVAKEQFILECLVEELYNTNELEGVRSTREEIARSTREVKDNNRVKKRFHSMIALYLSLVRGKIPLPETVLDIRKIYDSITKGEIEKKELPDGEMFRKDPTYVYKKSGTGKIIHRGLTPESKIIDELENLLHLMNEDHDIPLIIRIAVGHYYFGYIHPFYDGNGRTSRFISSMYMSKELGQISAMSLSRGCNKYRKKYLEAFENTNSIKNCGEMNHFIETFLDIIGDALKEMNSELLEKDELLRLAERKIQTESKLEGMELHQNMMFVLAQNYFFDFSEGLTVKELADATERSEATIRKALKELIDLSFIHKKGERPAYYTITSDFLDGE